MLKKEEDMNIDELIKMKLEEKNKLKKEAQEREIVPNMIIEEPKITPNASSEFIKTAPNYNDYMSLEKLMANRSPNQFAKDFIYEKYDKKKGNDIVSDMQTFSIGNKTSDSQSKNPFRVNINPQADPNYFKIDQTIESSHASVYTEHSYGIRDQFLNKKQYQSRLGLDRETYNSNIMDMNGAKRLAEKKEVDGYKKEQEEFTQRLLDAKYHMEDNRKDLKNYYQGEDFKECTFAPKINKDKYNIVRDLPENIVTDLDHRQKELDEKKKKAQLEAKYDELDSLYEAPYLGPKTHHLAYEKMHKMGVADIPVHERLYKLQNKNFLNNYSHEGDSNYDDMIADRSIDENSNYFIEKSPPKIKKDSCTFNPEISKRAKNIKRDEKVDDFLYNDAKRREINKEEKEKEHNESIQATYMSYNSENSAAIKIFKNLLTTLIEMQLPDIESLNYLNVVTALQKMHFLQPHRNGTLEIRESDKQLVADMWHFLSHGHKQKITILTFAFFLLAVMNINGDTEKQQLLHEVMNSEEFSPYIHSRKKMNQVHESIEVTAKEVQSIHQYFRNLYYNRIGKSKEIKIKDAALLDNGDFKPAISETSTQLANAKYEKIMNEMKDAGIDVNDPSAVFNYNNEKLQKIKKAAGLNKIEKGIENCTFQPNINKIDKNKMYGVKDYEHRSNFLYKVGKEYNKKEDRDPLEIDYEKNCDECTFQPVIHKNPKQPAPTKSQIRGLEKFKERQLKAQKEKELKEKIKSTGNTGNAKTIKNLEKELKKKPNNRTLITQTSEAKYPNQNTTFRSNTESSYYVPKINDTSNNMNTGESPFKRNYPDTASSQKITQSDPYKMKNFMENNSPKKDNNDSYSAYKPGFNNEASSIRFSNGQVEEPEPIIYVDINLGQGVYEKICVYEWDNPKQLAEDFCMQHGLEKAAQIKLESMISSQLREHIRHSGQYKN